MSKKYTHIFFDLDNTLWDFETNSRSAMLETFNSFKLAAFVVFEQFFEGYTKNNHLLWEAYRKNAIRKNELTRLRFQLTFDELGISGIDAEAMNSHYLEVMPDQKQLNSGAVEILQYLKQKSYKIAVITNGFKEVQYRKIETSGLKTFLSGIYISELVQSAKPDRGIFEYAVKSSNAPKAQSLMIGDDWEVDIAGAVAFGIDAVYYDGSGTNNIPETMNTANKKRQVYRISQLSELKLLL